MVTPNPSRRSVHISQRMQGEEEGRGGGTGFELKRLVWSTTQVARPARNRGLDGSTELVLQVCALVHSIRCLMHQVLDAEV